MIKYHVVRPQAVDFVHMIYASDNGGNPVYTEIPIPQGVLKSSAWFSSKFQKSLSWYRTMSEHAVCTVCA